MSNPTKLVNGTQDGVVSIVVAATALVTYSKARLLYTMVDRIDRRKRNRGLSWSRIGFVGCVLCSNFGPAAARTWEVLVQPAVFILLDHDMIRQIPEGDPVFTQTELGTDPPTKMPVPTPNPVPQPTSEASSSPSAQPTVTAHPTVTPAPVTPTISPRPTAYVSYPPGEGPTMAPTPIYRNENIDDLCPQSELAHEIHMQDMFGDGWDGRNLTITVAESPHILSKVTETQIGNSTVIKYKTTTVDGDDVYYTAGKVIWTGTLNGAPNGPGDATYSYTCIRPGVCYEAYLQGGAWAEEMLWEVKEPTFNVTPADNYGGIVIAKGGAPSRCLFSIPDPLTQTTFCPTTCNRFPLDPTPFPSESPTTSAFPSGVPSSNFPSQMPSWEPSSLYEPSEVPSDIPSLDPSEGPSGSPTSSEAPSLPADTPTPLPSFGPSSSPTEATPSPTMAPIPATTAAATTIITSTNSPPTLVDIGGGNNGADAVAGGPSPAVRQRQRRQPTVAAPPPPPTLLVDIDHGNPYSDFDSMTVSPASSPPPTGNGLPPNGQATSDGVAYNRPYRHNSGGGGNVSTRQSGNGGGQGVQYRNNGGQQQRFRNNGGGQQQRFRNNGGQQQRFRNNGGQQQRFRNNGNQVQYRNGGNNNAGGARSPPTAAAPTPAPPTAKKEVLDISQLGNGVR